MGNCAMSYSCKTLWLPCFLLLGEDVPLESVDCRFSLRVETLDVDVVHRAGRPQLIWNIMWFVILHFRLIVVFFQLWQISPHRSSAWHPGTVWGPRGTSRPPPGSSRARRGWRTEPQTQCWSPEPGSGDLKIFLLKYDKVIVKEN